MSVMVHWRGRRSGHCHHQAIPGYSKHPAISTRSAAHCWFSLAGHLQLFSLTPWHQIGLTTVLTFRVASLPLLLRALPIHNASLLFANTLINKPDSFPLLMAEWGPPHFDASTSVWTTLPSGYHYSRVSTTWHTNGINASRTISLSWGLWNADWQNGSIPLIRQVWQNLPSGTRVLEDRNRGLHPVTWSDLLNLQEYGVPPT